MKISISIDVPSLAEGEAFYVSALGCEKLRDQGRMVVLRAGNADVYLLEKGAGSKPLAGREEVRSYERHWTPVHLDFLCENVDETVGKILAAGGAHEGGEKGEWGAIAYCVDPFGNGFCVINE